MLYSAFRSNWDMTDNSHSISKSDSRINWKSLIIQQMRAKYFFVESIFFTIERLAVVVEFESYQRRRRP